MLYLLNIYSSNNSEHYDSFALLTCSQSGQNQSSSGMTMIGGRRHAVW